MMIYIIVIRIVLCFLLTYLNNFQILESLVFTPVDEELSYWVG